jgi:hypothetical protein
MSSNGLKTTLKGTVAGVVRSQGRGSGVKSNHLIRPTLGAVFPNSRPESFAIGRKLILESSVRRIQNSI